MKMKIVLIVFLLSLIPAGAAVGVVLNTEPEQPVEVPQNIALTNEHVLEEVVKLQVAFNKMAAYIGSKEEQSAAHKKLILNAVNAVSQNQSQIAGQVSRVEQLLKNKARPTTKRKARRGCGPKCRARKARAAKNARSKSQNFADRARN